MVESTPTRKITLGLTIAALFLIPTSVQGDPVSPDCLMALSISTSSDLDCDGMSNEDEIAAGANPVDDDTDGDGVKDGDDAYPTDPTRASDSVVVAGGAHSCKLQSGIVSCWGRNEYGQLGDGTNDDRYRPVVVAGITDAVNITAGYEHTCAVLADGSAKCWGRNHYDQLGDGNGGGWETHSTIPVAVTGLTDAVSITAGYEHTCAVLADGSAKCWGTNFFGQLGDNTDTHRKTPVDVHSLTNAVAITAGYQHTCAVLDDGYAKCWGNNAEGQLGDGNGGDWGHLSRTPVAVQGISDAVSISAGNAHTCAVLTDGTAKCWGYNWQGRLGDGTNTNSNTPVTVNGLNNAASISAGNAHTCAVLTDGTAKCWGSNGNGQLGDGTNTQSNTPVTVQ